MNISDREIEYIIYFCWKYIKNINPNIRIRGSINWNWIFSSLSSISVEKKDNPYSNTNKEVPKNKRPLSAGEGRSLIA